MNSLRREHGFLAAFGALGPKGVFASPEFMIGVPIGLTLTAAQIAWGDTGMRVATSTAFISIASALLGVVFAGFAMVVAFLSPDYQHFLQQSKGGLKKFFQPFIVSIGMQCMSLLVSVFHLSLAAKMDFISEQVLFGIAAVLFCWNLLDIVALARNVLINATARARHDAIVRKRNELAQNATSREETSNDQ